MGPVAQAVLQSLMTSVVGTEVHALADLEAQGRLTKADHETLHFNGCLAPIVFTGGTRAGWSCFTQLRYYTRNRTVLVNMGTVHLSGRLILPQFEFELETFSF